MSASGKISKRATEKDFNDFVSGDRDPLLDLIKDDAGGSDTGLLIPRLRDARLENTYRTEPRRLFSYCKARKVIERVFGSLEEVEYSAEECAKLAVDLCDQIRVGVKLVSSPRYKIAVIVHIGEKNDQGLMMGSRCVWNSDFDTFASASFTNSSLFAVGLVFACYFE